MDRNQPLIGGKLELEGAQAFVRTAQQLERAMVQLNNTMKLNAAERVARRLTSIARSFDTIGAATKGAAKGLAAVNKQVETLGRRTKTIDNLAKSIAGLHLAQSAGIGKNVVKGGAGLTKANTDALLSSIAAIAAGGGLGGGGSSGLGSVRRPVASSPLRLPRDEVRRRQQNAGIIQAEIDSRKEIEAENKKHLQRLLAENDKWLRQYKAQRKAAEAKKQADTDMGFAWLQKREEEIRKDQKTRLDQAFKNQATANKQTVKDRQTTQDRILADTQRVAKEERLREEAAAAARKKRVDKEIKDRATARAKEDNTIRREAIARARTASTLARASGRGGGGGRLGTALGGGGGSRGGGRGGASRPADFIPGLALGSTAYLRANVGPTAIYSRMPLTLTSIGAAAVIAAAAVTALGSKFAKTANSLAVFSDATARQNKALIDASIALSRQYGTAADAIAASGVALAKAGAPVEDLNNGLLEYVTILTEVSQGELSAGESATLITQIITAMGLKWDQVGNVVDTTTGVIQNSAATFDDLAVFVQQLIPVGAAVGFTYDEMAITFGVLRQAGLGASVASTALKNTMLAVADPTSEAAKILDKYKISLFDAAGNALPLIDVITDLWKAFGEGAEGVTDAQQFFEMADIASTRQILAVSTLASQGPAAYAKLANASRKSSQQMAQDLQNNPIKQLELLGRQIEANALLVAKEFTPTITNLLRSAQLSLGGTGREFTELGKTINSVLTLQNEFTRDLVNTLAPGAEAAIKAIGRVFLDAGDNADDFGKLVLKAAKLASDGLVELSKGVDRVREGFKVAFGPALLRDIQTIKEEYAKFVAFLNTVSDYFTKPTFAVGVFVENDVDRWNRLLAENLKTTRDALGLIDTSVDSARETFATSASKLGLAAEDATKDMVKGIEYATGSLADASSHTATLLVEVISDDISKLGVGTDNAVTSLIKTIDFTTGKLVDAIGVTMDVAGSRVTGFMDEISLRFAEASATAAANIMSAADFWAIAAHDPMPNSMGFWDLPGVLPPTIPRPIPKPPGVGRTQAPGPGGGGSDSGPNLDEITAQVKALLSDVPGLTDELFRFVAGLAQDVPARLMPMVNAIKASREQVGELLVARRGLLEIDFKLLVSARRLASLQNQMGQIEIQQSLAVIGYDKQLLGLRQQILEIDAQMAPIQDRMLAVDRQMAKLQEENLVLARQRIEAEMALVPVQLQLEAIERRISDLDRVDFAVARKRIELDLEALPIKHKMEDIEKRIADLGARNYNQEIASAQLQLQMLPIRQQIEDVERQIAEIGKRNFQQERERVRIHLQMLPIQKQLSDIEEKIAKSVDRRAGLYKEIKSLDLADVEDDLQAAWDKMDIASIIALEAKKKAIEDSLAGDDKAERRARRNQIGLELQKIGLEEQLEPLEKRLQILDETETTQGLINDLTRLGLEEQIEKLKSILLPLEEKQKILDREKTLRDAINEITKIGLERELEITRLLLEPIEKKRLALEREEEKKRLLNDLTRLGLEEEKQRIQDLLRPLQDKLDAINREIDAENRRNALLLTHLEEEKRKLQEQLIPLEDQRKAIERIVAEVDLLRARATLEFEERKIGIQKMILDEQLRQLELEATRKEQELLFGSMVLGFIKALKGSEAFTLDEALEVAKRGRLWDDQVTDLFEISVEFEHITEAALKYKKQLDAIDKNITITITTVHKDVYEGGAGAPGSAGTPSDPPTAPTNGAEPAVTSQSMRASQNVSNSSTVINNNYSVAASYSQVQSPASIGLDMRAMIQAART